MLCASVGMTVLALCYVCCVVFGVGVCLFVLLWYDLVWFSMLCAWLGLICFALFCLICVCLLVLVWFGVASGGVVCLGWFDRVCFVLFVLCGVWCRCVFCLFLLIWCGLCFGLFVLTWFALFGLF